MRVEEYAYNKNHVIPRSYYGRRQWRMFALTYPQAIFIAIYEGESDEVFVTASLIGLNYSLESRLFVSRANGRRFLACPWGSIINGHRLPRVTITPFSVLKSSFGRPCVQRKIQ